MRVKAVRSHQAGRRQAEKKERCAINGRARQRGDRARAHKCARAALRQLISQQL